MSKPTKERKLMPISIVATEGVLPEEVHAEVFIAISDLFLKLHQLAGNSFMTPNVIGEILTVPKGKTFAGGKTENIVIVELKVPSFALNTVEQKQSFVKEATDIIVRASGNAQPAGQIWVNVVYAVDGLWGIGGRAYTNADLGEAISRAVPL
jgi:phenylpyruvate tautomerase PptA (4-oxalocrotonate tautomerase family)